MERIKQFEIIFSNNHNCIFYPGQLLQGHVILETHAPVMTRGIQLQYTGCLNIHWTELTPGTAHRCVDTKEFSAYEEYFNSHRVLSKPGIIYPGEELVLEFEYKLPVQLPESYGDDICQTEYHLEARVKHDDNINHDIVVRKEFSVSNPLDLNTVIIPDILSSSEQHASQTFGCWYCTSSPISASLKIRHSGYTPGQKIRIYGEIENNTGRNTKKANVRLMQQRMYYTPKKKRTVTDEIARVKLHPITLHSRSQLHKVSLVIPTNEACYNVDPSQILEINYYLEMVIEPTGAKKIKVPPIQVVLGKIPLRRTAKTKTGPTIEKLHINRQQSVINEVKRKPEKSARARRKDRERKVAPSEQTDTSDYVMKPTCKTLNEDITVAGKLSEKMVQSQNWTAI